MSDMKQYVIYVECGGKHYHCGHHREAGVTDALQRRLDRVGYVHGATIIERGRTESRSIAAEDWMRERSLPTKKE